MWLFKEIVNEVIDTGKYKKYKPNAEKYDAPDDEYLKRFSDSFSGGRYYLDLGGRYGKYPIVTLSEMIDAFKRNYLDKYNRPADAEMVLGACKDGFFNAWIASKSVAPVIAVAAKENATGDTKPRYYSNKGTALELIFGKGRGNKSDSDIIGAELKAYAGHAPLITLFDLAPYEIYHCETPDSKPVKESAGAMKKILESIRAKACPPENASTKQINRETETSFNVRSHSYARVIIQDSHEGSKAESIGIHTQFYAYDEEYNEVPIDAIDCIYSIKDVDAAQMNNIRAKKDKKNLFQTIQDKIQTVFSFTTTQLEINGDKGLTPGDTARTNSVYSYSSLHVSSIKELSDLLFNFIECINSGDIVVSFKITKTLSFSARFAIKNNVGSYDKLYRDRKTGEVLYQHENEINAGSVDSECMVQKNEDGTYTNDYKEWTDAQWNLKSQKLDDEPEIETDDDEDEPSTEEKPAAQDQVDDEYNDNKGFM